MRARGGNKAPKFRMNSRLAALELDFEKYRPRENFFSKTPRLIHVPPFGDEHVLHHGHARLQWFVSA